MWKTLSLNYNDQISNLQQKGSDIMQRSILGHILPEAMVHYLENHSAEKFAETFLGEFDTPEAIWSAEMRSVYIEIWLQLGMEAPWPSG